MADLIDGRKVVTTSGTEVQLAASQAVKSVTVQAETDNTSYVVVGTTTVVAALATRQGIALAAGDTVSFAPDEVSDLGDIWIDAVTNGDGVTFLAVTE